MVCPAREHKHATQPLYLFVLVCALVAVVAIFALVKLFKVFNSPDGERYRRMNVQGPIVPLSPEEIEADRKRIETRAAALQGEP